MMNIMDEVVTYPGALAKLTAYERAQYARSLLMPFIRARPELSREILKDTVSEKELNQFMREKQ